jgi:galactokinase
VTADRLVSRLAQAGLRDADIPAKRLLFGSVLDAFTAHAGSPPADAWWVPGRLEIFGKHTDYCGGRSLVGTVPRGFAVAARRREDGVIRLLDAGRREALTLAAPAESPGASGAAELTGWRNYVAVVARRLARNFPGAALGADIVFASDLPSASGMSSSSALMVGVAAALVARGGVKGRDEWRRNIRGPADEAGYYACIENGLSFGTLAGDAGVGTHGGSEDHLAILCGGPGTLAEWRFVPIRPVDTSRVPDEWCFVVASSGVAADKTGAARDAYNRLSREAASLLALWSAHERPAASLAAALSSAGGADGRLRDLIRTAAPAADAPALERRLAHFLREDRRPGAARLAFTTGDREALAGLSAASQHDAESLLRNQVPETIALVRQARELGAFASSSFGAGFGGSVWALADAGEAARLADEWLAAYLADFPLRTNAMTFIASPGPGLTRLA